MIYVSDEVPKSPASVVSLPKDMALVPPGEHAALIEKFRVALTGHWTPGMTDLANLLETMATVLDANAGDLTKLPPTLPKEIHDAAVNANQFIARDRFYHVRARLAAILLAEKP